MPEKYKNMLIKFISWFDVDTRGKTLIMVSQFAAGIIASLLTTSIISDQARPYYTFALLFLLGFIFFISLLVFAVTQTHGLNYLICKTEDGVLMDKKLDIYNVALRKETLNIILSRCCRDQTQKNTCLLTVGRAIAKNFIEELDKKYALKKRPYNNQCSHAKHIFSYDTSSGFGKINLMSTTDNLGEIVTIEIQNPITDGEPANTHSFLAGYLGGVLSIVSASYYEPIAIIPESTFLVKKLTIHLKKQSAPSPIVTPHQSG